MAISGCPVRNVLARVGDKWSLLVMLTLCEEGVMRFGQLLRSVEDISQKSLTMDDANIPDTPVRWQACRILLTKETQQY